MTDSQSVTRDAGRALDREIALAIFGTDAPHAIMSEYDLPYFSTDIACAWEVVEQMRMRHREFWLIDFQGVYLHRWRCEFRFPGREVEQSSEGDTAPHAICLAALQVMAGHSEPLAGPPKEKR